ncbi:PREDICTED: cytochrome b5-like isoform X2 [Acromyrmex echinatior]|uniref:cytochrome b5-like isoform X2 n=1 Tax=Acromyrmex echinatior TaxID=103372 RepID=UPI000580FE23|nr:PREDICTED: cytochrome b5-like isoform X2 [Acromyrmex echinatior]
MQFRGEVLARHLISAKIRIYDSFVPLPCISLWICLLPSKKSTLSFVTHPLKVRRGDRLYKEEKAKGHRDMAEMKVFTRNEIKKNDDKDKVLFILHDKVYNVRSFLNEHPGGEEILLEHKGIDASEDFDDVGHSKDAMELMKTYQVGVIADSERMNKLPKKGWTSGYVKETEKNVQGFSLSSYLLMGGIALVAVLFFYVY